jgi:phage FluMu protein Com
MTTTGTKKISQSVDLIASGYDWWCPHCEHLNQEIELAETVRCRKCQRTFIAANAEHAYP